MRSATTLPRQDGMRGHRGLCTIHPHVVRCGGSAKIRSTRLDNRTEDRAILEATFSPGSKKVKRHVIKKKKSLGTRLRAPLTGGCEIREDHERAQPAFYIIFTPLNADSRGSAGVQGLANARATQSGAAGCPFAEREARGKARSASRAPGNGSS